MGFSDIATDFRKDISEYQPFKKEEKKEIPETPIIPERKSFLLKEINKTWIFIIIAFLVGMVCIMAADGRFSPTFVDNSSCIMPNISIPTCPDAPACPVQTCNCPACPTCILNLTGVNITT